MSETKQPIRGAGGGGGKGGGGAGAQRAPNEAPNSLRSKATATIMDIISEGPIEGFVDGAKSVFFDDTPLQAADGSYNYQGVNLMLMAGTPDQDAPPAYAAEISSREVPVGQRVSTKNGPVTKQINTSPLTRARVTMRFPAMFIQDRTTGDVNGVSVRIHIHLKDATGDWVPVVNDVITGKCTSPYEKSYAFALHGQAPWQIRVTRADPPDNDDNSNIQDQCFWASYTEILDWQLSYPHTAYVALALDAELFGGSVPQRSYEVKGLKINVPANYDPEARSYATTGPGTTGGIWDGTFKIAWTNNPAWVFYDLLTNARYGLGAEIKPHMVDKWSLYEIAQYCDQQVPDGFGGWEPRFTFDGVINSREDAFSVLQAVAATFRGMVYFGGGTVTATQDRPASPVKLVTNANVLNGEFSYEGSGLRARHTAAMVLFSDRTDSYRPDIEPVNGKDLGRRGLLPIEIVGLGLTRRSQARRLGRWALDIEQNENQTVTYRGGLDHCDVRPGDIVLIADRWWQGTRFGGRVAVGSTGSVTVDSAVSIPFGQTASIKVTLPSGALEERELVNGDGDHLVLTPVSPFSEAPSTDSVWMVAVTQVNPRPHRVISVAEVDKHVFEVTALFHDETKYDRIEQNLNRAPPSFSMFPTGPLSPPSQITIEEFQSIQNGVLVCGAVVSWRHSTDPRARSYQVEMKRPNAPDYERIGDAFGNSIDVLNLTDGEAKVRVRSIDPLGRYSAWVERTGITLLGTKWVPDDVEAFDASVLDQSLRLSWSPVRQHRSCLYRIKQTPGQGAWQSAVVVADRVDGVSTTLPTRDGTFLIKAVSLAGVESANARLVQSTAAALAAMNTVVAMTEAPAWDGEKTSTAVTGNSLVLSPGQTTGTYVVTSPDLGAPYNLRMSSAVSAAGVTAGDFLGSWSSLSSVASMASGGADAWAVDIEFRVTPDDPVEEGWGPWRAFEISDVEARAIQFRLTLRSFDNRATLPEVEDFSVTLDVPDRVEGANDVAIDAAGMRITFENEFRETPAIAIVGQSLATGDYWQITNQDTSGFDIRFFNAAGTGIARTADWIAKGFGRKRNWPTRLHARGILQGEGGLSLPTAQVSLGASATLSGVTEPENLVPNPYMTGAGPGVLPNGWTISGVGGWAHELIGRAVEDGKECFDFRIYAPSGTGNINNYRLNFIPSIDLGVGDDLVASIYHRHLAGDLSGFTFRMGIGSTHTPASDTNLPPPTSTLSQVSTDRLVGAANLGTFVWYGVATPGPNGAGAGDITIRIALPSLLRLVPDPRAVVTHGARATLNGTATMAAKAAVRAAARGALLGQSGMIARHGTRMGFGVLAGAATVTAKAIATFSASGTLAGGGSVSANARANVRMAATLSGSGSISANARANVRMAATLAGSGALAAPTLAKLQRIDMLAGALPEYVTFTRNSKAWYFAAPAGGTRPALTEAAVNEPCFEYDPTLAYVEGTNPWGDGVVGAALPTGWAEAQAGTNFDTTVTAQGLLADGTPWVELRITGTPGNTTAYGIEFSSLSAPGVPGDVFSYDIGACVISGGTRGTSTVRVGIQEYNSAPAVIAGIISESTVAEGSVPVRYTGTRTLSNVATVGVRPFLRVAGHAVGVALDFRVRVSFPFINRGSSPLSTTIPVATLARRANNVAQNARGNGAVVGTPGTRPTAWGDIAGNLSWAISGIGANPDGTRYIEYTISGTSNGNAQVIQTGTFQAGSPLIPCAIGDVFSSDLGIEIISMSGTGAVRSWLSSLNSASGIINSNAFQGAQITGPTPYRRHRLTGALLNGSTAGVAMGLRVDSLVNGQPFNCVVRLSAPILARGSGIYPADLVSYAGFMAAPTPLYGLRGVRASKVWTNLSRNPRAEGTVVANPGTPPTGWGIAGTGGLSREMLANGTLDGIPYARPRLFGTASGGVGTQICLAYCWGVNDTGTYGRHTAAAGQSFTVSAFLGFLDTAPPAVRMRFRMAEYDSTGAQVGAFQSGAYFTPPRVRTAGVSDGFGAARHHHTFTVAGATTTTVLVWLAIENNSASTALDFSLMIGAPQLNKTKYVGPIILPDAGSPGVSTSAREMPTAPRSLLAYDEGLGLTLAAGVELMGPGLANRGDAGDNRALVSYDMGASASSVGFEIKLSNGDNSLPAWNFASGTARTATIGSAAPASVLAMATAFRPNGTTPTIRTAVSDRTSQTNNPTTVAFPTAASLSTGKIWLGTWSDEVGGGDWAPNHHRQLDGWLRWAAIYDVGFNAAGVVEGIAKP